MVIVVVTVVVIAVVVVVTVVVDDSGLNGGRGKDGGADGRSCDESGRRHGDPKPGVHLCLLHCTVWHSGHVIDTMLMDGDRPSPRGLGGCTPRVVPSPARSGGVYPGDPGMMD